MFSYVKHVTCLLRIKEINASILFLVLIKWYCCNENTANDYSLLNQYCLNFINAQWYLQYMYAYHWFCRAKLTNYKNNNKAKIKNKFKQNCVRVHKHNRISRRCHLKQIEIGKGKSFVMLSIYTLALYALKYYALRQKTKMQNIFFVFLKRI